MSLHIYYAESTVPKWMEIIRYNDAYFDADDKCDIIFEGKRFSTIREFGTGVYKYENRL